MNMPAPNQNPATESRQDDLFKLTYEENTFRKPLPFWGKNTLPTQTFPENVLQHSK